MEATMDVLEMTVPMPGESINEVEISTWLVSDGDYVEKDQSIAEIDSDKATLELPAEQSGIINIKIEEGEAVKDGEIVCLIKLSDILDKKEKQVKVAKKIVPSDKGLETDYKVGEVVRWCWCETHQSTYFIIDVNKKGVLLKQNFGMGQTLTGRVPINEIEKN